MKAEQWNAKAEKWWRMKYLRRADNNRAKEAVATGGS